MNPRRIRKTPITWTTVGGLDYSQPISVADYRDVGITIVGTGDVQALATKDIKNSNFESPVDFTASSTIDNSYAALVIADETTPNTYVTTFSVSSATKLGEVNTNEITFVCLTRSVNTVDAFVTYCDNQ